MRQRIPLELLRLSPTRLRPASEFWAEFRSRAPARQRLSAVWMVRPFPLLASGAGVIAVAVALAISWWGSPARAAGVRLDSLEIGVPHRGVVVVYDSVTSGMIVAIDAWPEGETER